MGAQLQTKAIVAAVALLPRGGLDQPAACRAGGGRCRGTDTRGRSPDCPAAAALGRAWFSPAGVNVYISILLRPRISLAQITTLPLVVGCVVARTVTRIAAEVPVKIKWPNDLHVNGRKLGGILCEMVAETDGVQHVVVGIGINVNLRRSRLPALIARTATSLAIETRRTLSRAEGGGGTAQSVRTGLPHVVRRRVGVHSCRKSPRSTC